MSTTLDLEGRIDESNRPSLRSRYGIIDLGFRLVQEKPLGAFGLLLCFFLIFVAVFADVLAPYGLNETSRADQLAPPSATHWFGADQFGRDILSRTIHGARISMYVGFGAVVGGMLISTALALVTGYFRGPLDTITQRFVDAWMSFPPLIITLAMMTWFGPGVIQVIIVLSLSFGIRGSRVLRGQVMSLRGTMYAEAAQAIGARTPRILLSHILPNLLAPIVILASVELPAAILIEASLSFLGFGIPPPTPSWGQMLAGDSRQFMTTAWWMAFPPGVALSMAVFGWNMLGDALRDLLDPRLRGSTGSGA